MRRLGTTLLVALGAATCACQDPPAPVVTAVRPAGAPNDVDTSLAVWGAHFLPAVKADMNDPAQSQVNASFALDLVRADGTDVPLVGVTLVSEEEILATLPAGASPGIYDLHLVDPRGRTADLPSAFLAYVSSCSNPRAPDGTPCNDGNLCTRVNTCQAGVCVGSSPITCAVLDPCHPGPCDPGTGLCANPPAPDGTPCRLACIAGETCQAGVCTLPTTGCMNTAPLACLVVTPASGAAGTLAAGATLFTADASCSTDVENAAAGLPLTLAVDFGDVAGVYNWISQPPAPTHVYSSAGLRTASAMATDAGGLTTYAQVGVAVYDPTTLVLVTTAVDENDAGATPANPMNTGLSLREAINYVNSNPPGGPWTIGFDPIKVGPGSIAFATPLPPLTAPGAALVGFSDASGLPAVHLDFGGANQTCLTLKGPNQLLAWLLVTGCTGTGVLLAPGSAGSQVTQCQVEAPPGAPSTSVGVSAQDSVAIGPRNLVTAWATGVSLASVGGLVDGNVLRANGTGIVASGVPAGAAVTVQRNQVYANGVNGGSLASTGGSLLVRHNLFHGNGSDGLDAGGPTFVVRNNLFTGNAHFGVNAPQTAFAGGAFDHNGFFENSKGNTNSPLTTGPTDVLADPLYVDASAADFRLTPASPDVNAGIDTGLDVNGPAPGLYNGSAPDIGPEETPY